MELQEPHVRVPSGPSAALVEAILLLQGLGYPSKRNGWLKSFLESEGTREVEVAAWKQPGF